MNHRRVREAAALSIHCLAPNQYCIGSKPLASEIGEALDVPIGTSMSTREVDVEAPHMRDSFGDPCLLGFSASWLTAVEYHRRGMSPYSLLNKK